MLDKIDATIIEESEKFLVKNLYVLNIEAVLPESFFESLNVKIKSLGK